MKKKIITNSIIIHRNRIDIRVGVYLFKDGEYFIAYCPSLDLIGYSDTVDKAKDDFEFILKDWLEDQVNNKTLNKDLVKHGWKINKQGGVEPLLGDIPNRAEIEKVVNLPEYTKTSKSAQLQYC